ncbi:MAG: hypothetical protein WD895_01090 [Acidimicrobiia bacterium]
MSITLSPAKARYLEQVRVQLSDLPEEEREEIVQDLEAHLTELDDGGIQAELGDPVAFAAEFRTSAGLDQPARRPRWGAVRRFRDRLDVEAHRLDSFAHWQMIRPIWIWTRGWLVVSVFAGLTQETPFLRFPIPSFEFQSAVGATLVASATWFSVWLDGTRRHPVRDLGTSLFSMTAVFALMIGILSPISLTKPQHFDESAFYPGQLMAADGTPVENIYAYDLEGNPVEVLLFDQAGRPLLSLATYVYEDAEFNPGVDELDYGNGSVTFQRDQFGRIIPNLYPLQLSTYDESGGLAPMQPPSFGLPTLEGDQQATPRTTIRAVE